jgi:hypothetical protein
VIEGARRNGRRHLRRCCREGARDPAGRGGVVPPARASRRRCRPLGRAERRPRACGPCGRTARRRARGLR